MKRTDVEKQYQWNTEELFPSDEAWEREYKDLEGFDFSAYKGKLSDRETLLCFYRETDAFSRRAEKLYLYASMRRDEDVREGKYVSFVSKMQSLFVRFSVQTGFADPELLRLPPEYLLSLVEDKAFSDYDYALSRLLKEKEHVLSEEEERILSMSCEATEGFRDAFTMLDNADLPLKKISFRGERVRLTHGLYGVVMREGTRKERKACFRAYYKAYGSLLNVISSLYAGNVKKDVFYARARGYNGCLEKALSGEDVDPVVYENLLLSVREALPLMHRYMAFRKESLGLREQHMYDLYVPLAKDAGLNLSFEEAYDTVEKGLSPLGREYGELLERARKERWIDVYENEGKRSGAYSTGCYDSHPYVLLNYQSTTNELFTIAHEMGHSVHTYLSNRAQPYAKSSYTIFLAEIASTVNEVLLLKYLLRTTKDQKLKAYLLNYYIEMFRTTLFRQTQFAEFEDTVHRRAESGEALTREYLCETYYKLNQEYYGNAIVHDEEIAYEWARIPHFYRSFYVYKYATGFVSAVSIARRILEEGASAVEEYFRFLSGGGKTCPVDILKAAGVDLTGKEPFRAAMRELEETLCALEKERAE